MTKVVLGLITVVVLLVAGFFAFDSYIYDEEQHGGTPEPTPSVVVPAAGPITVQGVALCLPHRDTSGPQTMECAFGIKDSAGRYFALRDSSDDYANVTDLPFNSAKIEITGTFTPRSKSNYQDIGIIEVGSARLVDPLPVKLGDTVSAFGVSIAPTGVVEDSRCPIDVTCIQAGTVRVRAMVSSGSGTAAQVFILGKTVTTEAEEVTLVKVDPAPRSTEPAGERDYTFYFDIKNR